MSGLPSLPALDREIAGYTAEIVAIVDEVSRVSARHDAPADGGLLRRVTQIFNGRRIARLFAASLRRRALAGEGAAREALRRQLDAYVRVRPRLAATAVATVLRRVWPDQAPQLVVADRDAWITTNVRLITSIGRRLHGELKQVISDATDKGSRAEVVAKRIAERFDVARSRAKLIARDQITKYAAQVNEAQQRRAGVDRYTWRHSRSRRNARATHVHRDGRVFRWDRPPADGHPGQAIQCRCTAEPVLEDLLG